MKPPKEKALELVKAKYFSQDGLNQTNTFYEAKHQAMDEVHKEMNMSNLAYKIGYWMDVLDKLSKLNLNDLKNERQD